MVAGSTEDEVFGSPEVDAERRARASPAATKVGAGADADAKGEELKSLVNRNEDAELQLGRGVLVDAEKLPWDKQRVHLFGRIRVVRFFGRIWFIGPHWYCTIIMLSVINMVGWMFVFGVGQFFGIAHLVGGVVATLSSTWTCLMCATGDPGIYRSELAGKGGPGKPIQMLPSTGKRTCHACAIVQPKGCLHCEYCHVCVTEYDHHCPWMSKCIGGRNLDAFYRFLWVSLGSLGYVVVATVMLA